MLRDFFDIDTQCHRRIKDPRPIKVHLEIVGMGQFFDFCHITRGNYYTTTAAMGVFEADQPGHGPMGIFAVADGAGNRRQRQFTGIRIDDCMIGDATKHRSATGFVVVDVAFVADDDFITATTVRQHRTKIPHGAAGDQQGGFFAYFGGSEFFEGIDGGIIAVDIITEGCIKNRLAHSW